MDNIGNVCIISAGYGHWYGQGVSRLERSLLFHGYAGALMTWKDELPENCPPNNVDPYAIKIYAFKEAFNMGYRIVLWLDASFCCIKNPHTIFDIINDHGVFAFRSGYNCAQTCTDHALFWAQISRDEAEQLPEIASGIVGLNMDNPDGKNVFNLWVEGQEKGLFINSRNHNLADSSDPRFLHARQDQSIFSLAVHKTGLNFRYEDYVSYYDGRTEDKYHPNVKFLIGGL
jgi:hypothetical protein